MLSLARFVLFTQNMPFALMHCVGPGMEPLNFTSGLYVAQAHREHLLQAVLQWKLAAF